MKAKLKKLIQIIKIGNPQEVKLAKKEIEHIWNHYYIPHRHSGKKAFSIFVDELAEFENIKDDDHKAYFIHVLKWAFWTISEDYFDEFAAFIYLNIQHSSGKVRQAIILSSDIFFLQLTHDIGIFHKKIKNIPNILEQKMRLNQFGFFVLLIEKLIRKYYQPKFARCKYVDSLPVGVYKSLQKFYTEVLLPTNYQKKLFAEFLEDIKQLKPEKTLQIKH